MLAIHDCMYYSHWIRAPICEFISFTNRQVTENEKIIVYFQWSYSTHFPLE